jgi:hypothetical protein
MTGPVAAVVALAARVVSRAAGAVASESDAGAASRALVPGFTDAGGVGDEGLAAAADAGATRRIAAAAIEVRGVTR